MIYEIFVLILAGLGAGIVTGLMGASAVVIAVPIMVIFLGYDIFLAIGISLGIDVVASIVAMFVYKKNKNLNIMIGIHMGLIAVVGTIIGTSVSFYIPKIILSGLTGIAVCFTAINMLTKKVKEEIKETIEEHHLHYKSKKYIFSMIGALGIGFIAGSFGAGGGLSLLIVLTFIMGFKVHKAIGTSVFIMIFIALSGSISHFIYLPFSLYIILTAGLGAILGAFYSAKFANLMTEKQLNKLIGLILFTLGISLVLRELFNYGYLDYFYSLIVSLI